MLERTARRGAAGRPASAEVLQQTQVDALDITILRGGGDEVGKWAIDHGFLLTPDAPEVLDFYSHRSKIFMAARFDASRAAALGQQSGDGTPIMLTIPTDEPWVPLRILALGLDSSEVVNADVFLLTDERPTVLAADTGVEVAAQRAGVDVAARRPALRQAHGLGARVDVAHATTPCRPRPASCGTTSRCRRTPTRCRRPAWRASPSTRRPTAPATGGYRSCSWSRRFVLVAGGGVLARRRAS